MIHIFDFTKAFRVLTSLTLAILILLLTTTAYAATVSRSKGKAVELQIESGEDFVKGDKGFFVANGKRVGKFTIVKVKGSKAIAKLVKGKAPKGATTKMVAAKAPKEDVESSPGDGFLPEGTHVGLLLGFASNKQSVETIGTQAETVSMSGTSISYKAYVDMPLAGNLGLIGRFGMENFNVKGTAKNAATCTGTTACDTKLSYITTDLLVRYAFGTEGFVPFVHGGLGIALPSTKTSNALQVAKIATTAIFYGGAGVTWELSKTMFVPIMVEYAMFPPDQYVSTSFIAGRAGFGMYF